MRRTTSFDPRWLALSVTTIGSFMSILDSTIVNIALPSILKDFHSNLSNGQLVLTVYLLSLAIVIPVSGFLADRVGMKRLYMLTLFGFTASSALCGLAWNLPSLIAFRAFQGLAGGMLQPLGMAIVFTMITPLERGRFMAILGLPMLVAPILGPTLGGYLVEYASWRMIFLVNLPIGVVNIVLARFLLKETEIRADAKLDFRGFALAAIAFPCLLLGMSEASVYGWGSPLILTVLGAGAIALVLFIRAELHHPDPLMQLRLFANPIFSIAMALNFVTQFSLFGIQYLLPLFLQRAHNLGAAETGLLLFPSGIFSFLSMNASGRAYNRLGPKPLALSGLFVLFLSTLALSRIDENTGLLVIAAIASMRGVAMGLCMMPVQTAAYNTVDQRLMPRATALTNVLFRIFGSTSTALLTTVLIFSLGAHGAPAGSSITSGNTPITFLVEAFQDGFLVMSIVCLAGMGLAMFLQDHALKALQVQETDASAAVEALA
ncbi:MAG TPA: MDR family MFS transporter [Dehalococcoidia bacterium]|jgi:EmrB/QacA subfamily drug resistance transporter